MFWTWPEPVTQERCLNWTRPKFEPHHIPTNSCPSLTWHDTEVIVLNLNSTVTQQISVGWTRRQPERTLHSYKSISFIIICKQNQHLPCISKNPLILNLSRVPQINRLHFLMDCSASSQILNLTQARCVSFTATLLGAYQPKVFNTLGLFGRYEHTIAQTSEPWPTKYWWSQSASKWTLVRFAAGENAFLRWCRLKRLDQSKEVRSGLWVLYTGNIQ